MNISTVVRSVEKCFSSLVKQNGGKAKNGIHCPEDCGRLVGPNSSVL